MKEEDEESQEFNESPATLPNAIPENTGNAENAQPENRVKIQFSIVDKWKEIMKAIKEKTGIDGIYVILFLLVCVILVYLGIFGTLITNMVGTIYPGFSTIKIMETNPKKKKEWLTYWVVFGFFIIIDMFSGLIMKIIPFYFVLKILFLIWMFLPGSSGCYLVYNYVILKLFKSVEDSLDFFFNESKKITNIVIKDTKKEGAQKMRKITDGFKTFNSLLKNRGGGSMEDAIRFAKEIDNEENALRNETQNDDYSGALKSNVVSFPNKMKNKYFKDQLNEIANKNEIKEEKEENKTELSNIILNNKSEEVNKEEIKLDKEPEKPKEKEEEKKEPEKPKEEGEGAQQQDNNFTEKIDDLEALFKENVFNAEDNKEDNAEKKAEVTELSKENNLGNKDNNE